MRETFESHICRTDSPPPCAWPQCPNGVTAPRFVQQPSTATRWHFKRAWERLTFDGQSSEYLTWVLDQVERLPSY